MAVKWANRFLSRWRKTPMAAYPPPLPSGAGRGPWGAPLLPKVPDQTSKDWKGEMPGLWLCGVWEGPREESWGHWFRSKAQTWDRAQARRDYLLGALCPTPSVRDVCECHILFVLL